MMRNYTLLTGATGLLGQYLMRDLLRKQQRVAVLVRDSKRLAARQRIEQILQRWERELGCPLSRPVCLTGDITQADLGLAGADRDWLVRQCSTMLHCAASLTFHEYRGEPWRTNVEGTQNVLQLCEDLKIAEMHYISTAYVCGHRHDLVLESELDVGQKFRNEYEESKFLAEKAVRACTAFDSLTVYRPVVITGDSVTGYTSTYHGTYLYMKLAKILTQNSTPDENGRHHVPVRWGLTGKERRNITPVDWNSDIICQLFLNPAAHGRTFHLAPSDPITMQDAIEYASEYYGLTGIEFLGFGRRPDFELNEMERWIWSNISIYGSYDFMDPSFDTRNLQQFAPTPRCPRLDKAMAIRLMDYAEQDRWGKRKPEPPADAAWELAVQGETWQPAHSFAAADHNPSVWECGLDVRGAGGGQWTLRVQDQRLVGVGRGLPRPDRSTPVLQASVEQLADWRSRGGVQPADLRSCCARCPEDDRLHDLAAAIFGQAAAGRPPGASVSS